MRDSPILLLIANQGVPGIMHAISPWRRGFSVEGVFELRRSNDQRALSVRQPWAYAILHLGKDVENRPWRTHYRGRILIQAALKIEREEALKLKLSPGELPTGAIVGSVEIVDCVRNSKSKWAIGGQWHWILKNPRYLAKLIPFKGALGFIRVPTRLLNGKHFHAPHKGHK